jgi:hypothetical protein
MIAINQLFDLLASNDQVSNKLKKLLVYHEDLEENDFDQVQQCLDDPTISYLNHSLIKSNSIQTQVQFLPKSFYEALFQPESIDILMCYTAIHWLPTYKSLTQGLWFLEEMETLENIEFFKKLSKECLMKWLNLRYEELKPNGLITMNIFESGTYFQRLNLAWNDYLKSKGFTHADLDKVNMCGILRSPGEVREYLGEVKDKFKVLRSVHSSENYIFAKNHFKAVVHGQLFHGLGHYPSNFPTEDSRNEFIDGYLDYYYNEEGNPDETDFGFMYLVLQKI